MMDEQPVKRARVTDIITLASKMSGISDKMITGSCRSRPIARVRQAVYMVSREHGHSYPHIGRLLGGRDHSTVIYGCELAASLCPRDTKFAEFVDELRKAADETEPFIVPYTGPIAVVPEPPKEPKPKNDFHAEASEKLDGGHRFHAGMRKGSAALLAALQRCAA